MKPWLKLQPEPRGCADCGVQHVRGGISLASQHTHGHVDPGVAVAPDSALLVGVNVERLSALAFAIGGAITAIGGALISTFLTLDPSSGVLFTLKALVIVIMGGVGDIRGTIITAVLGLLETFVATVIDPGLTLAATYLVFVLVLLFRPQGFGKPTS